MALVALFSIATLFGELHPYIELFTHFKLQYFIAALVLAAIFGAMRRRNAALLCLGLAVLNAWYVVPWYIAGDSPDSPGAAFTVMQANVFGNSNPNPDPLLAQIAVEKPDVIVIQELTPSWHETLRARLDGYPYSITQAQAGAFGIGLFSKLALENARIEFAEPLHLPEIRATLNLDGRKVHFASAHPMPPVGSGPTAARNRQLAALGQDLGRSRRPALLVGDLNISMWAPTYQAFEKASGLRNARKGFGLAPTFPVFFPLAMIPIDHVLVSADIEVVEFRSGGRIGSDHLPILATLVLKH